MHSEVEQAAVSVWNTVLGLPLEPGEPSGPAAQDILTGSIRISGEFEGLVLVKIPAALARTAAARMFSLPAEELGDDGTRDALAELTNMIGGLVKGLVPGPSKLSLPQVVSDQLVDAASLAGEMVCDVRLACEPYLVGVTVLRWPARPPE